MLIQSLRNQFLHDLKTSWPKTLLLAALFLIGLFFWIPPLVRAVAGPSKGSAEQTPRAAALVPAAGNAAIPADRSKSTNRIITWEKADELLATDPLVRSAEVAAIHGNPFQLAPDQFSPPILFAEVPAAGEHQATHGTHSKTAPGEHVANGQPGAPGTSTTTKSATAAATAPEGLVLKSTILGEKRRAALINDKLYSEGSLIQVDGASYILTVVRARDVQLQKGEQMFVLALPNAASTSNIRVERSAVRNESP